MAIREIFNYIKEHKNEFSESDLNEKLREQGYVDDDIKEAFLMWEGSRGAESAPEFKENADGEKHDTLKEAIFRRFNDGKGSIAPALGRVAHDFTALESRGEFWTGFFVPIAIYFFSLIVFLFLELFYPVPDSVQILASGIAVIVALILRVFIKEAAPNLREGVGYGIVIMVFWAIVSLLSYLKLLPFSLG